MMEEKREQAQAKKRIKYVLYVGMLLVVLILYAYMAYLTYHDKQTGADAYFVILNIVYVLLILLTGIFAWRCLFYNKEEMPTHKLFLLLGITIGLVYYLTIPLMAAPDERTHLYNAYELSNRMMGIREETVWMRADDVGHAYNEQILVRGDYAYQYKDAFTTAQNRELVDTGIVANQKPRYLYICSALGLTIGRLLHLSTTLTYMLGRLLNLILFLVAAYYAIKWIPFAKGAVLVWACLPITMQQAASFSYDAGLLALSILVIAKTLKIAYAQEEERKGRIWDYTVLGCSMLLLLPCKGYSLIPLVALPCMLIPRFIRANRDVFAAWRKKWKPWMKVLLIAVCAVAALGICYAAVRVVHGWLLPENINNRHLDWSEENGYTMGYLLKNPIYIVELLLNTMMYKFDVYLSQMLGGSLGWFTIQIPYVIVLGFLVVMVYAALRKEKEPQLIPVGERTWMWMVVAGVCALSMAAMLFYWTPISYRTIEGVQGRYFLPVLPLALVALRTRRTCVSDHAESYAAMWTALLQVFVVTAVFRGFI